MKRLVHIVLRAVGEVKSADEFKSITESSNFGMPIIIDFQKSGCKPCQRVAPQFVELSDKYAGKAMFFKVDADSSKEALSLMKANGVRSVPTFHLWDNGKMIDCINGAHMDELEDSLRGHLMANYPSVSLENGSISK